MSAPLRLAPSLFDHLLDDPPPDPLAKRHRGDHRVHPARTGKDAGIGHVQSLGPPDFSAGVDDALASDGTHPTGTHLMRRPVARPVELVAVGFGRTEELDKGLVVRPARCRREVVGVFRAAPDGTSRRIGTDLQSAHRIKQLGQRQVTLHDMAPVQLARLVTDLPLTRLAVHPDLPGDLFPTEDDVAHGMLEPQETFTVIGSSGPGLPSHPKGGHHVHGFDLDPVGEPIEVVEFGDGGGEDPSVHGVYLFGPSRVDDEGRVEVEVLADVGVLPAQSKKVSELSAAI